MEACNVCRKPKGDPRYRACEKCREGWRLDKGLSFKERTQNLVNDLVMTLKDCYPHISNDVIRERVGNMIIHAENLKKGI